MTRSAVYPGTFDPITKGHIDLIERGRELFDRLVVAVARNPLKAPLFTAEERKTMAQEALAKLEGVEVTVGVLGNEDLEALPTLEVVPEHEFYDYESKYVDEATELVVPAQVSEEQTTRLQQLALEAFRVLEGAGIARVDFFLDRESGEILLNEVNSLPGFTEVSMYPRLWQASGLPYPALLDRMIELALERHRTSSALERTYRIG